MKDDVLKHEARIFGRYLLGETPHDKACQLYVQALAASPTKISARDEKLLAFVRSHPQSVGLVDAGLSMVNGNSEVRRRAHLMFSILESMPEYHQKFLSQPHNLWYLGVVAYTGVAGIAKMIAGAIVVKAVVK